MDDDDRIIRQRLERRSMHAIAKAQRTTVAAINEVIDGWAASAIDEKIRKNTLALELARLDELQEAFYARSVDGDVQCGALAKMIEQMRGRSTPQTAELQIVDETRPQETSTDRIERVLNALIEDQKKKNDPTTH
jgi:hypothetical protein